MKFKTLLVCLTLVFATVGASASHATSRNFFAFLDGFQEAPPVLTDGSGFFRAHLRRDGSLNFVLKVRDLQGVFAAAHIHFAQKGVNGGIMVTLCGGPTPAVVPACSDEVRGTIPADLVREIAGQGIEAGNLDAVIAALRSGNPYINVHTSAFCSGEIRGQVR